MEASNLIGQVYTNSDDISKATSQFLYKVFETLIFLLEIFPDGMDLFQKQEWEISESISRCILCITTSDFQALRSKDVKTNHSELFKKKSKALELVALANGAKNFDEMFAVIQKTGKKSTTGRTTFINWAGLLTIAFRHYPTFGRVDPSKEALAALVKRTSRYDYKKGKDAAKIIAVEEGEDDDGGNV